MMKLPWMSRSDRCRWEAARTLGDVGDLMALWLEGGISSRPGYAPRYGPDEETTELVPVLAACNRGGYITKGSQPGCDELGFDRLRWRQCATVSGFVADEALLDRLRAGAARAGLRLIAHRIGAVDPAASKGVVVTTRNGRDYSTFGCPMPRSLVKQILEGCHSQAVKEAIGASQVTVIDPMWGRNSVLWPVLARAVAGA